MFNTIDGVRDDTENESCRSRRTKKVSYHFFVQHQPSGFSFDGIVTTGVIENIDDYSRVKDNIVTKFKAECGVITGGNFTVSSLSRL